MRFLDLFRRQSEKFYPFERRILEQVKSKLHSEASQLFQRQIDAVNKIQRLADGKEVNLYHIVKGVPEFDLANRFPELSENESLLARVRIANSCGSATLNCEVWLVDGRLFSLEFNRAPKGFFVGGSLTKSQTEIVEVRILLEQLKLRD